MLLDLKGERWFSVVDEVLADDEIRDPKIHVKKNPPNYSLIPHVHKSGANLRARCWYVYSP